MAVGQIIFSLYHGEDKEQSFRFKTSAGVDIDFGGSRFFARVYPVGRQLRVIDELTSESGRIFLTAPNTVVMKWPHDVTDRFPVGRLGFDLFRIPNATASERVNVVSGFISVHGGGFAL